MNLWKSSAFIVLNAKGKLLKRVINVGSSYSLSTDLHLFNEAFRKMMIRKALVSQVLEITTKLLAIVGMESAFSDSKR